MSEADDTAPSDGTQGEIFDLYVWLADQIAGRFPPILSFQAKFAAALPAFTGATTSGADMDDPGQMARSRIVNQATNDFMDLFYEAMSGRGRPAARSARTLYEHLVNLEWVTSDGSEAQRFCDHAAVGELLDLELNTPSEEQFSGGTRKRVRHAQKKLERRIRPAEAAVIGKYGKSFQRSWTKTSLRDRASQVGLDVEYDCYRLLSAVIHGTAGGDLGHRREIDGKQVVRTGPAIAVCPYALKNGLAFYRRIVGDVATAVGLGACQDLVEALADLADALPVHEALCDDVDRGLWPTEAPAALMFLRVEVDGTWTWLLLDGDRPMTIEAEPVGLETTYRRTIQEWVQQVETANSGRSKPIVIHVSNLRGVPRTGATWQPASENLRQPRPEDEDQTFRTIHVREPMWDPSLHD
jgi:hypothetical protein